MKRRRLIALISLCTLLAIGLLIGVGGVVLMRTDYARNFVQTAIASRIHGTVHVGRISGNPLGRLTVDTFAIRDTSGVLVVSTGPVTVEYDIRDIMDSRLHLRRVDAEHPLVHLRDFGEGRWNYKLAKRGPQRGTNRVAGGWGSLIVLDSITVRNASFLLSMPWDVDDTLKGRVRDSVVEASLRRTDRLITRTAETRSGLSRTYTWTRATALISRARIADPDTVGQEFRIARLDANEFDPPFKFRNVRGVVRRKGDSAWFNMSHWDLPGSTGSASGKLVWGSDLPMRYDIVVRGDSVSLRDVNWVYTTLPKTGSGKMILRISNKRNFRVMDYHVDSMNVRSTGSHLIGEMTFGVGGRLPLQIRNVNLRANPVDFALIETLSGKPLPVPWAGQIFGDVRAPGGLVTDFDVTSFRGEWRDSHVPGAVSRMSGSGGLDIQFPAFTAFKGFDLDVQTLDLRSIQYLFPAFPKLNGTLSGTTTLDSVWTDVRFSNADITHRDGPGTPSHFTGSGRVTDGRPFITYDVDLNADPISFDMLRRSFPGLTLRGLAYGPLQIKGQSPNLQIVANLLSAAGRFRFAGNIDIDSLGGYGARGVGEFADIDLSRLGVRDSAPKSALTGRYTVDVRGATPGTLTGAADIRLGRSTFDAIPLDSTSRATLRFENGRVITSDTTVIDSPFGRVTAFGALGLPRGGTDSIALTLVIDRLGNLAPYFAADGRPAANDSLGGTLTVNGFARGRVDSLFLFGKLEGDSVKARGLSVGKVSGEFSITDMLRNPSGFVTANLWGASLGGLRFDSVATRVDVIDSTRMSYAVDGRTFGGDSLSMSSIGGWTRLGASTTVRVDTFALGFGNSRWRLEQPATLFADATMVRVDTLGLRSNRGGTIGFAGVSPVNGAIDMRLSASRIPLSDLDRIVGQVEAPVSGVADFSARMLGTREAPIIDARTTLDSIMLSNVGIGRLFGSAQYANDRMSVNADIFQGQKRVLTAVADSLPLAIRWLSYDTLPGRVRARAVADSADFTLIQAFVEEVSNVSGKISGSLSMDGSWGRPNLLAAATLSDGGMRIDTLGIALSKMYGAVQLANDTLRVDSVRASSGGDANTAHIKGTIDFRDWTLHGFNLAMTMNDFLAYNRLELATIYARTIPGDSIRLTGVLEERPELRGIVFVDRGAIYLPDPKIALKRFSALDSAGFLLAAPTKKTLYERITQNLYTDLTARIGGEFSLSADYANIPLSGDLNIVPVAVTDVARRTDDFISKLAPVGTITTQGGTYELQFPPFFSKSFDVQRGGTVTFDRDARWNGVLDVTARYVVRKPGKPDVPIAIQVTDRLLSPRVRPRSEAAFPISESDVFSYIIFDEPGFDVLQQNRAAGAAASIFAPIATSATSELIRKQFFGRLDQFKLQTAAVDPSVLSTSFLASTRLTGGEQLGPFYVSLSAGLCSFDQKSRGDAGFAKSFGNQLGGNLEYRLRSSLTTGASWSFSAEPGTQDLLCGGSYNVNLGIVPTPRQYSLSYLKFWRW